MCTGLKACACGDGSRQGIPVCSCALALRRERLCTCSTDLQNRRVCTGDLQVCLPFPSCCCRQSLHNLVFLLLCWDLTLPLRSAAAAAVALTVTAAGALSPCLSDAQLDAVVQHKLGQVTVFVDAATALRCCCCCPHLPLPQVPYYPACQMRS
jgi:hypothetical protein